MTGVSEGVMKEELLAMAKRAGFPFWTDETWAGDRTGKICWSGSNLDRELEEFAQLVYDMGVKKGKEGMEFVSKVDILINEILEEFDFERVSIVMEALDWRWSTDGIPSISLMKDHARRLIRSAAQDMAANSEQKWTVGSGGFEATVTNYPDEGIAATLRFVVTEWTTV